jgi:NADH dehydrogenase [ubiquinone] 1 alpha subcomplex assembly factor 3
MFAFVATDLLVLGLGNERNLQFPGMLLECRHRGLNLEVLTTEKACATFNFLTAEGRCVAAALIPPEFLSPTEDDIAKSNIRHGRLNADRRQQLKD